MQHAQMSRLRMSLCNLGLPWCPPTSPENLREKSGKCENRNVVRDRLVIWYTISLPCSSKKVEYVITEAFFKEQYCYLVLVMQNIVVF